MFGRETRSTFSLEYSCASLILVEYSCLAAVIAFSSQFFIHLLLELSVSFEESTLLHHLYLFGELSNKIDWCLVGPEKCYVCGSGIKCLHESF